MRCILHVKGNAVGALVASSLCVLPAACVSSSGGDSTAQQVIATTEKLCAFVPTVTSILAILSVPGAPAADKLAQVICAEVEKQTSAGFTAPGQTIKVVVDGMPVTGTLK